MFFLPSAFRADVAYARNTRGIRPAFELRIGRCSTRAISERSSDDVKMHSDGFNHKAIKPFTFIAIVVRSQLRPPLSGIGQTFSNPSIQRLPLNCKYLNINMTIKIINVETHLLF